MGPHTLAFIKHCRKLGLNFVGSRGPHEAKVVIIGEAPGENEDKLGLPFVGYSGKLQDEMLLEAGFDPDEVWFTNPYKVRPPDNDLSRIEGLGIPKQEHLNAFWEEINERKPTILIPVGATSLGLLCPETVRRIRSKGGKIVDKIEPTKWRGSILKSPNIQWNHYVVPNFHPAFVLRTWRERQFTVLCYAKALREWRFFRDNGYLYQLPSYLIIVEPSWDVLREYLLECISSPEPLSIDIEMFKRTIPYVLGIAISPTRAISFRIWEYPSYKVKLFRLLNEILTTKRIIGQNFISFDSHWLSTIGLQPNVNNVDDTLVRHHVLWPELEHKLQFQTIQYTRQAYYKEEGKNINVRSLADRQRLMRYNGLDCCVTYEIFKEQREEFSKFRGLETG